MNASEIPISSSMTPVEHVVVVVPAHNEAERIGRAIDSVDRATQSVSHRASCTIVVVADACSDDTKLIASQRLAGSHHIVIETAYRVAGAARRDGVHAALKRLTFARERVWIASTDADTVVPTDWISLQLSFAERGADAVAGVVSLTQDQDLDDRLVESFKSYYQTNSDGTHGHVHGANLGVRASAYSVVGGWRPVTTGEDHDLWNRLRFGCFNLISSASLWVSTSARRAARAPKGFAADLVALDMAQKVA